MGDIIQFPGMPSTIDPEINALLQDIDVLMSEIINRAKKVEKEGKTPCDLLYVTEAYGSLLGNFGADHDEFYTFKMLSDLLDSLGYELEWSPIGDDDE